MLIETRTSLGFVTYVHIEEVCTAYGAHGVRVGNDGSLDVLILQPDGGSNWESIDDLPLVQTQAKPARARKS